MRIPLLSCSIVAKPAENLPLDLHPRALDAPCRCLRGPPPHRSSLNQPYCEHSSRFFSASSDSLQKTPWRPWLIASLASRSACRTAVRRQFSRTSFLSLGSSLSQRARPMSEVMSCRPGSQGPRRMADENAWRNSSSNWSRRYFMTATPAQEYGDVGRRAAAWRKWISANSLYTLHPPFPPLGTRFREPMS